MKKISDIKTLALGIFFTLILVYAWFETRHLRTGPSLSISSPIQFATVGTSIQIVGKAERATEVRIAGYPITVDPEGNFKEDLALYPGVNTIPVDATDKFNNKTQTEIVVKANEE